DRAIVSSCSSLRRSPGVLVPATPAGGGSCSLRRRPQVATRSSGRGAGGELSLELPGIPAPHLEHSLRGWLGEDVVLAAGDGGQDVARDGQWGGLRQLG